MVELRSDVYGEQLFRVEIGKGLYTAELPSNIPDGFSQKAYNLVATGDSLENRIGIRQSSVDWHKVQQGYTDDTMVIKTHAPNVIDSAALVWNSYDHTGTMGVPNTLCLIRSEPNGGMGGDGFMEITLPAKCRGVASYQSTIYFLMDDANRVYKVTALDWAADSITYASIPSAASILPTTGLYAFKDRLWTVWNERLYFTEVAPVGGLPETWTALNYVVFSGIRGRAEIQQVVPLGNKLLVFTRAGAFSLLVEGEPESWILRTLDSESVSLHRLCAFESKGIVYFVNSNGVFATNGSSVAKISGVIEDQFFLSKGIRGQALIPFEDGMILSIMKYNADMTYDAPNCRIFYSKTDPVAWTEWNLESGDGTTNAFGANRICMVMSASLKISTFLSADPVVYFTCAVSDSTAASPQNCRTQLLIFDGGQNQARDRAGNLITAPLNTVLKTKYVDCGNHYRNKTNKRGLLELYTSDSRHNIKTSWDMDATTGTSSEVATTQTTDFTVGQATNLIQIPSDFKFRRCALTVSTALQTNESQIKIKDVTIVLDEDRSETERVR